MELQKPGNRLQKTTANDRGRTSPTSCRHASNKLVFINNKFNIQRKAILFIKISVFNRNLCISEDQPLHPMYKCSFSLDFALIKHFANYVVSTEVHNLSICSRSNLVTVRAYHQGWIVHPTWFLKHADAVADDSRIWSVLKRDRCKKFIFLLILLWLHNENHVVSTETHNLSICSRPYFDYRLNYSLGRFRKYEHVVSVWKENAA